jgi:hypothetical protein
LVGHEGKEQGVAERENISQNHRADNRNLGLNSGSFNPSFAEGYGGHARMDPASPEGARWHGQTANASSPNAKNRIMKDTAFN